MAEQAAWRMGEFLRIAILFLWDKPAGASTREIMEAIADSAGLTAEETSPVPGAAGFPLYEMTTRSAMTALEKAGWLVRENGRWLLTNEGRVVCRDFRDASDFYIESQRIFESWRSTRPSIHLALEYAREKALAGIRWYLQGLTLYEFRFVVRDLLVALGQHVDWIAPPAKNRGHVDMIAYPAPLRGDLGCLMVQVKHSGQAMTAEGLEALVSEAQQGTMVLCISSAGFTEKAMEFANAQAAGRVILMDLDKLMELWVENYDRLTPDARQRFPVEAVYFLSLPE